MKSRTVRIALIIVTCGIVIGINSLLMPHINTMRDNEGLTRNVPLENAPPQFILTVNLLGGLRCIVVDMLWLRTMKLREEGKFFEMAQLYKWICELEPQIEEIWAHNAWNMAYNISFEMPYPNDRWRWIRKAIHLLRDLGLQYNNRSAVLRREIAWIYAHKIGQQWDDMHWYYKKQLALEFEQLIYGYDDLKAMRDMQQHGLSPELESAVNILDDAGIKKLKEFRAAQASGQLEGDRFNLSDETVALLSRYLRAEELKKHYKRDISVMVELMDTFGPLDWRLPEPHAMYWAWEGKKYAEERFYILYDRLCYLSLQSLCRRGKLTLMEQDNDVLYITSPEKRFIEPMDDYYQQLLETYAGTQSAKNIGSAYYHFLNEAVMLMYTSDDRSIAEKLYAELKERYPEKVAVDSLDRYVIFQFMEIVQTGTHDQVKGMLFGMIREAYWNLALGETEQYEGYMELAQNLSQEYNRRIGQQQRLVLPPIQTLQKHVLKEALEQDFPAPLREALKKQLEISLK